MIARGDIAWWDFGQAETRAPAKHRPVVVVQSDNFNRSRIGTVVIAVITSKTRVAAMPGNVFLPASASGLSRDSVINVSQLVTVDRDELSDRVGEAPAYIMTEVSAGLRRVLDL